MSRQGLYPDTKLFPAPPHDAKRIDPARLSRWFDGALRVLSLLVLPALLVLLGSQAFRSPVSVLPILAPEVWLAVANSLALALIANLAALAPALATAHILTSREADPAGPGRAYRWLRGLLTGLGSFPVLGLAAIPLVLLELTPGSRIPAPSANMLLGWAMLSASLLLQAYPAQSRDYWRLFGTLPEHWLSSSLALGVQETEYRDWLQSRPLRSRIAGLFIRNLARTCNELVILALALGWLEALGVLAPGSLPVLASILIEESAGLHPAAFVHQARLANAALALLALNLVLYSLSTLATSRKALGKERA